MGTRRWTAREITCAAATAAGILLRFHRLSEPLWYDEAMSMKTAASSFGELPEQLARLDSSPPLFAFLLKGWIILAGGSDASVHAFTAILGVGLVASVSWIAYRLAGRSGGWLAAALTAAHPWAIMYSQEVRAYGLLTLTSLWSCWFLWRALETESLRDWAAFAAVSTAGLYTHNYTLFLLLGQAAWVGLEARRRPALRKPALACAAALAAAWAPWLPMLARQARLLPELPPMSPRAVEYTVYALGGLWVLAGPSVSHWPPGLLAPLAAVEAVVFVAAVRRLRRKRAALVDGLLLCSGIAVAVPMLAALFKPIYLAGRYAVIVLPQLTLLTALGLEELPSAAARLALPVFFAGCFSYTSLAYFSHPKSYEKDIADFVAAKDRPGYLLLAAPAYRAVAVARYYPKAAEAAEPLAVQSEADLPPGLILMVEQGRSLAPAQRELLARDYRPVERRLFGNLDVSVLKKIGP